jgi:hypothetical protein
MTRVTGFLVGVLLMSGIFLLTLSTGNAPTLVKEVVSRAAETPQAFIAAAPASDVPADNAVDSTLLPVTDTVSRTAGKQAEAADSRLALEPQSWNQSVAAHETDHRSDTLTLSRYQVWSPFRSEWAANGFARRLLLATDVPVEVINESPGNYQVVFSYRDEGERQALVERIETVTGLELE